MTDTTTTTDPIEEPAAPEPDEQSTPNREAAKYRTRLREAEAALEPLQQQLTEHQGRIEALQRTIVERAIRDLGLNPEGVLAVTTVGDFLGDDGHVDPSRVQQLATDAATRLGLARTTPPREDPSQGVRGTVNTPSWGDLIRRG